MNKKIAYIFPGQGSQYVGMGLDFFDSFSVARETFEEADELLKEKLSSIIFQGSSDLLTQTRYSQIAIFVTSIAILRTIENQFPGIKPEVCSGLSLGEYTALAASDHLTFKETLFLIRERGRLMHEACEKREGTMAAVIGCDADTVASVIENCKDVWVANYNCPQQTVISGTREGIEKANQFLKENGAKKMIPLSVHGAFHSGLMQGANDKMKPLILEAPVLESARADLVMNVSGNFVYSVQEIKNQLIDQMTHSIRWEQSIRNMDLRGIQLFLEIGCGKTLSGLNRKIGIQGISYSIDKVKDLEQITK